MSKFPKLFASAAAGTGVLLVLAYNFADRNVTPMPERIAREFAVATPPSAQPAMLMAANAQTASTGKFGLGRAAFPEELAAWDVEVSPDGTGLPPGSGDVLTGETIFEESCAVCHGSFAEGVGNWPKLAGGDGTLADDDPVKTVGSYWPYLSTLWDYIHRSMPFGNAQSLSDDEVYAIVAYILYSNSLVEDDFVLSNENFLDVELPNADGFIVDDREKTEYVNWTAEPCMVNCKENVEITMRARVLDVTPQEDAAVAEETEEPVQQASADIKTETETPMQGNGGGMVDMDMMAAGERGFKKCKACHQVGENAKNRTGPVLNGILGNAVASNESFKYSKALREMAEAGVVWDEATLAEFLSDPKGFAKGTRMSFRGLSSSEEIAAIVAYLSTFEE